MADAATWLVRNRGISRQVGQMMLTEPIPNDNVPTEGTSEVLNLVATDPEVVAELRRLPAGIARQRFALDALRIGVLSMRAASGELDVRAVRDAGQQLVIELRGLLAERGTALTATMAEAVARYFDPATGVVTQKLERLTKDGGELDRVLRQHVGDESTLVRTLAAHVGEASPLLRMLSPAEASGVRAQIERTVAEALRAQAEQVLQQFSLDRKDSALSRLIAELTTAHAAANSNMQHQVKAVVGEFSLDRPDSALSRLVGRVEAAQKRISDEFSLDNQESALNKLTALLASLQHKQTEFATSVQAQIATLTAQRAERARGTRHGEEFEAAVGTVLAAEAQRVGDIYEVTGTRTGLIKNSKVGDHVVTLGPDSSAPGSAIVFEAKQSKSVALKAALAEIDVARKNRQAQVGVFVYSTHTAPAGIETFTRYGESIVVAWAPEDPQLDWVLRAAYSVARALVIRERVANADSAEAVHEIEVTVRAIEKHLKRIADIKRFAETTVSAADKIVREADKMAKELEAQLEALDEHIAALRHGDA
ncbi:MAG TPA: hypothetical protein VH165_05105 [Kofleriaceae bacterium]|jgi:hypothetical protein|nr:hypothetical protein [Kofleriaceae bacterium]